MKLPDLIQKYIQFTIKSKDGKPILFDYKTDNTKNSYYYYLHRFKNSKFMEDISDMSVTLLPKETNAIYINNEIIYLKDTEINECETIKKEFP